MNSKERRWADRAGLPVRRHHQQGLFPQRRPEALDLGKTEECQVVAVGKRRDGGTRYWCLRHKADATAKYGRPAKSCCAAHLPPLKPEETFGLDVSKYKGGVALWGAVPAVYDTTRLPMDRGIHVHARLRASSKKEMDCTLRAVRIIGDGSPEGGFLVSELDAIYYMVASVFGYEMRQVICSHCGHSHLDRDWFSLHPHRRHLCAGCGRQFYDSKAGIGNPICGVRDALGIKTHTPRTSTRKLTLKQADYPAGIQVWGSNPAFIWTSDRAEEAGIHVHAFREVADMPDLDETYCEVVIDGVKLDPAMVRILMAQNALPSLKGRVIAVGCPSCREPQYSVGEFAFTPNALYTCEGCGNTFPSPGRVRKTVANPLLAILAQVAEKAPRQPQRHDMGLMPETL